MKPNLFIFLILLCIGAKNYAQIVNIPDANFKAALVSNAAINTNGDSEIQVSEASAYTDTIDVNGLGISDLTGIEAFVGITTLSCDENQLTSLNITNNTNLKILSCYNNNLKSLDISNNIKLEGLNCAYNKLTFLNTSNNIKLQEIYCAFNMLTSLNTSNNINLTFISCMNNLLSALNVSNNINLAKLYCLNNQLNALDIFDNINLQVLECYNNPNLTCIQVWDTAYANWTVATNSIDPTMYFSLDCNYRIITENLGSFTPNPASDYLYIDSLIGEKNVYYAISDISGRSLVAWQNKTEVPIRHLPAGIYFLAVKAGDKIVVKKFVKE